MPEQGALNPNAKIKNTTSEVKKAFSTKKLVIGIVLLLLSLFPLLQIIYGGLNYHLHFLLYTFMYIAMASGWNIIGGYTGYASLGHNVFFAIGGYFSGALLVFFGLSPFITVSLAGLAAMITGLVFGLISLRTKGPAFLISTLALARLVRILLDNWDLIGGSNGISMPLLGLSQTYIKFPFYYGMLLVAIAAVFVSYKIQHSRFGLGLRAISQDDTKAEVVGINTRLYMILAFAISASFVGAAGAL